MLAAPFAGLARTPPGWLSVGARVERVKRELARMKVPWKIEGKARALCETFVESAETDLGSTP